MTGTDGSRGRMEAELDRLRLRYVEAVQSDVAALTAAMRVLRDAPGDVAGEESRAAARARLQVVAHDVKGQGGAFGFPLVTEIAAGLCRLLRGQPEPGTRAFQLLEAHVAALEQVVARRLTDAEDPLGRTLARRLARLTEGLLGPED